ncbi:MAG: ABC transporter ATP-binding protein [Alphaproteobacteria bacterium]|nr:ABC transporter ATP-binding protein [Alphaproteobacteria bacterium]
MTLLSVDNLSVSFGPVAAVSGVSFAINKGETLALVGESGSGKSVTALSILQLLPYPNASHPSGSITFDGKKLMPIAEVPIETIRGNRIAMIFQEPMTSLNPLHTIEKQISEVLFIHKGMNANQARARALELLNLVALPDAEQRLTSYPHELSGGQRQRVMIAMALANDPDLLIADEPTTALDVTIQAQILALLKDIQKKFGMALLLITHDLGIVRHMADRVCVMQQGKLVEQAPAAQLFSSPQHPYTKQLLAAEPKGEANPVAENAKEILQARNIKVHFPIKKGLLRRTIDYVRAVDDVSLSIRAGETIGIVGESGSGKTTLGLALLRLLPAKGEACFKGQSFMDLKQSRMRPLRRSMQIVFQDPYGSLSPRMTVGDIIAEGLDIHKLVSSPEEREERIAAALSEVGMDKELRHRYPHEFSGGQRQRISIARAIMMKPELVILDEPTSALDMSVQAQIIELLRDLQKKHGLAYLFISHDLRVIRAMANKIMVMKSGQVVEQGDASAIFDNPEHEYTKTLLSAAFNRDSQRQ